MSKRFGVERLAEQAADVVAAEVCSRGAIMEMDYGLPNLMGDSPIERLFYLALDTVCAHGRHDALIWPWDLKVIPKSRPEYLAELKAADDFRNYLILQRQIEINDIGRVDFLLHAYADWPREPEGGIPGWRRLIVECDGHDFHERTKEQASRDRARDRSAALAGLEVFRFTGSELWKDPWGCALQVFRWAERGV
jgi:hypothetical protein